MLAALLAEALKVVAIDGGIVLKLLCCFPEVFRRQSHGRVTCVELSPLEEVCEQGLSVKTGLSQVSLPAPRAQVIVQSQAVPMQIFVTSINISLGVVVSNLNRALFLVETRDKQTNDPAINHFSPLKLVHK